MACQRPISDYLPANFPAWQTVYNIQGESQPRQSAAEGALSTEEKACRDAGMHMIGSKQAQCESCRSPRIAACLANSPPQLPVVIAPARS